MGNPIIMGCASLQGKILYNLDLSCHNFKFYVRRHDVSVGLLFLVVYIGLNLGLIIAGRDNLYVSSLVAIILFTLAIERTLVYLKMKLDRDFLQNKEKEIKSQLNEYDLIFNKLKYDKKSLETRNKVLQKQRDYLLKEIKKIVRTPKKVH